MLSNWKLVIIVIELNLGLFLLILLIKISIHTRAVVDFVLFQFSLGGNTSCADWININMLLKSQEIATELAVFVEQRCNCSFPPSCVIAPQFTCPPRYPKHVTYRASVNVSSLPAQLDRSMLRGVLEAWPLVHRSVLVQGERLSVEETCPVIIQSREDEHCVTDSDSGIVLSLHTVLIITVPALIAVLLVAAAIVMVVVCVHLRYRAMVRK